MTASREQIRAQLATHPLHQAIRTLADLRHFMECHVACVWDFMTLLKSLQRDLTTVSLPWLPAAEPEFSRFINEIVVDEEADELPDGRVLSHFAWYLEAMRQVGADTTAIEGLITDLRAQREVFAAIQGSALPDAAKDFSLFTFRSLQESPAVRAAIFFHGREELIPAMFLNLVEELQASGLDCDLLAAYLDRHVVADRDDHGPRAAKLAAQLAAQEGNQPAAEAAAAGALQARLDLWNAIFDDLPSRQVSRALESD